MDDRPVVWDAANLKHLGRDHPERRIAVTEIDEVLANPGRIEIHLASRKAYQVIGQTSAHRWLVVIWIDDEADRYPIHAREASTKIIRRISK